MCVCVRGEGEAEKERERRGGKEGERDEHTCRMSQWLYSKTEVS